MCLFIPDRTPNVAEIVRIYLADLNTLNHDRDSDNRIEASTLVSRFSSPPLIVYVVKK